jgi:hypothetical protein
MIRRASEKLLLQSKTNQENRSKRVNPALLFHL